MAAGKSTLARDISNNKKALLLCEDKLLATLYPGEIVNLPTYAKLSNRLKSAVEQLVVDLLSHGISIVLDFPANTISQRGWLVGMAVQARALHEIHYIELSDSTCKLQLLKRAAEEPDRASTDTVEMFDAVSQYFEPPSAKENLNLIHVDRGNI